MFTNIIARNRKTAPVLAIVLAGIFFTSSCKFIYKKYVGLKDPVIELDNKDRIGYYQPFIDKGIPLTIHSIRDTSLLFKAFREFRNFPKIFIEEIRTDSVFELRCYEDLPYDIQDINRDSMRRIKRAAKADFDRVHAYLREKTVPVHSVGNISASGEGRWNVYIVSGTFLGKKLQRKTLPVLDLKGIRKVEILDISVNKQ